jgi:hypothetical protein
MIGTAVGKTASLWAAYLEALFRYALVELLVEFPNPEYVPKLGGKSATAVPQVLSVGPRVRTSSFPSVKKE